MKRLMLALAGLAVLSTSPAVAQTDTAPGAAPPAAPAPSVRRGRGAPIQTETPRRGRAAPAPTAAQITTAATALAATLKPDCQVTEAILRGNSTQGQPTYEVACATGPGYVLIAAAPAVPPAAAVPATAGDCVDMFGQADLVRSRDPAADVGLQCTLPANQDVLKVVSAYAKAAGVACTVDQGSATGVRNGTTVYEVGCSGEDGYWVERAASGWTSTPCIQLKSTNGACRYTTDAEQAASLKAWLAGSEAATCDVTEARYMGANANGSFFEAKCNGADGVIVRFNTEKAVQQVYPCATAQRVGGGCKLTEVPAAPAPAAAPPAIRE